MFTTPSLLAEQFASCGLDLPDDARVALETLEAIQKASLAQPATAVRADVEAGKVTPNNAAKALAAHAQALLVTERARQASQDFVQPLTKLFTSAIRANTEALIVQLRTPFDEAASVVQAAGRYFPANPTAEEVLAGGAQAAAVWEQLNDALRRLAVVGSVRVQLGDLARHGAPDATWYIATADDAAALDDARRAFALPGDRLHNLAAAGFTLRLNTASEATEVAALARRVTDEREAAEREKALDAHRKSWAPSLAALSRTRA